MSEKTPAPSKDLAALRREYERHGLLEEDASADAVEQFHRWFDDATRAGVLEPNAMTLATASSDGGPRARIVLLKQVDARGFVFFTNYDSRKGADLGENPRAALVFFWPELERQVRVEGRVTKLAEAESDAYFEGRPRGSQLGAWASRQSAPVASRAELEASLRAVEARFEGGPVPRPSRWGGYVVSPERIEFWQGRPSRLHDRLVYVRVREDEPWSRSRLSP